MVAQMDTPEQQPGGRPPRNAPDPASTRTDDIDTGLGTVHMVLGGGGVSGTTNQAFFKDGSAKVITAVSATPGANGKRTATHVKEEAVWTGVRDLDHPHGFAAFTVDPGRFPGDTKRSDGNR